MNIHVISIIIIIMIIISAKQIWAECIKIVMVDEQFVMITMEINWCLIMNNVDIIVLKISYFIETYYAKIIIINYTAFYLNDFLVLVFFNKFLKNITIFG